MIYISNAILIKIPFYRNRKNYPKIHMKSLGIPNRQNSFDKEKKLKDSHFLISRLTTKPQYSKQCGTSIKRDKINQCNRVENPEIKLCISGHVIFDKVSTIQWGKGKLFNQWCWLK